MIQIDDAGNGAVLGGEVIGALRVETGEYHYRILPLSAYEKFEIRRTDAARDAVLSLLEEFKPAQDELIVFCTGDVFKQAKEHLTGAGVAWQEEKITGDLQELVEATFFNSLRSYGLPERFRAHHHDYHTFHTLVLNWVCQDLGHRSCYCKPLRLNSGLVSRAKIYKTLAQKPLPCAACDTTIDPHSLAILDKTQETVVYYHLACFSAEVSICDYQEFELNGAPVRSFVNKFTNPPACSHCGQKIKYKKRTIVCQEKIYHFSCFSDIYRTNA